MKLSSDQFWLVVSVGPTLIVRIDDKVVAISSLKVSKNRAEIIFTSDDLPFGVHKIEIENECPESGTSSKTPLTLCVFLFQTGLQRLH